MCLLALTGPVPGRPLTVPFRLRTSGKGTDMAIPLGMEKFRRIYFVLKPEKMNWVLKTGKSRTTHAKGGWELVRIFSVHHSGRSSHFSEGH